VSVVASQTTWNVAIVICQPAKPNASLPEASKQRLVSQPLYDVAHCLLVDILIGDLV
jgi:hypothetical protein